MFVAALRRRGTLGAPPAAEELLTHLAATHPGDRSGTHDDGRFVVAQSLVTSTPESHHERVPSVDPSGRVVASWLRLDNRAELAATFGWDARTAREATDPEYLAAAYDRWREDCAAHLEGDFAFTVWNPDHATLYAARDAVGIRPLYYAETRDLVAVATAPRLLTELPGVDASVRPEWLTQFLHSVSMSWDRSPFAGVAKLPPGHQLLVRGDDVTVQRYHQFRDDAPRETTQDPVWLERYRDALHEAVRGRIRSDDPIGVETSGGIDSSTILALIPTLDPTTLPRIHAYGYADLPLEPEYILETSRVLHIPQTHIWCGNNRSDVMDQGIRTLGHPAEHGSAVGHVPFYMAAQAHGARTLHSGHGGDEVVTNPGNLYLRELLKQGRYAAAARNSGRHPALWVPWMGRQWTRRNRPPVSLLRVPMLARLEYSVASPEALRSAGIRERVEQGAAFEAPYRSINSFIMGNRIGPHLSTRTAEGSVVAAAYGLEYRWALLDRRLMQQYLSTPSVWKFSGGMSRYLHRRAIDGVVPDKVAWKPTKDMSGQAPTPTFVMPTEPPLFEELHPLVAEQVDAERWRAPSPAAADPLNMWTQSGVLSAWLWSRD